MTGQWRWPALAMFAAGYGANQFVPLLALYRRTLALSDAEATAVFGVYALGLVPGLILGGRVSDARGRRPVMVAFTALSLVATAVLITGQWGVAGLYAGRLLTGVVSGTVFTAGTAWVKELSGEGASGTGARRAALALTAGFGVGPLVAGPLAQWAPAPQVLPYLVHLALAGTVLVMLPRARETLPPGRLLQARAPVLPPSVSSARFLRVVVPMAPWVFGSVTLAFTTLPGHGTGTVGVLGVAFPGLLAAGALAAGVISQPLGRRLHEAGAARGGTTAAMTGLGIVAAGCAAAAFATARPGVPAATVAALVLGAGYGICLIVGLREVEEIAAPGELGAVIALFYCLAYSGLAIPYLLALVAPHTGYPEALLFTAAAATLTLVAIFLAGRRGLRAEPEVNNT
ncbi:MFS transporter [Paenarthrobacter sp. Z7-10]|uniref:MFS transporter n=1 Tax=Paenarthrobacter sp. Z7-10 TaxID=2787635 RepID=UPI0022A9F3CA|nr:MFS transporter [Paenarthrobacter sp. Z7-10]MCZ2402042.1 MFS transporter [Paenarthrobacter sp. Z7-10]